MVAETSIAQRLKDRAISIQFWKWPTLLCRIPERPSRAIRAIQAHLFQCSCSKVRHAKLSLCSVLEAAAPKVELASISLRFHWEAFSSVSASLQPPKSPPGPHHGGANARGEAYQCTREGGERTGGGDLQQRNGRQLGGQFARGGGGGGARERGLLPDPVQCWHGRNDHVAVFLAQRSQRLASCQDDSKTFFCWSDVPFRGRLDA
mmetsp:Transcript_39219/g.83516  ORF Transcript_39219/g.83516 Transcript_39219/m.83516 type:complete len:205 (-) Transcript_39219:521-1135(-)